VHQAVAIAKEFPGVPIKLTWSRFRKARESRVFALS
jgi:hypothetical protein